MNRLPKVRKETVEIIIKKINTTHFLTANRVYRRGLMQEVMELERYKPKSKLIVLYNDIIKRTSTKYRK